MKTNPVEVLSKSYITLLKNLKSILIEGLRVIEEQRVKTYWNTGKLVLDYLLENKQHGDGLFLRLSEDLGIDQRTLYHSVEFYETFPNLSTCSNLTWSQCRLLITVDEKQKRDFFKTQAIKQHWTVEKLRDVIRLYKLQLKDLRKEQPKQEKAPKLSLTRGRLFTYKLIEPEPLLYRVGGTGLLIDCGFYFWRQIPIKGIQSPEEGQIIESIQTEQGYKFKSSAATKKQLYTYKTFVERVIDADTIWVNIDLGFASWTRQKLRFRGIDAPEISTKKGEKAKEFVEATLSKVKFIIIRSTSLDKYGRPLSDIFYLEGEDDPQKVLEKGTFLNQQLLDLGLAKIMKD